MSKKNVSAIVSGAGWIGSLADGLIKALRERGVSDEAIHGLVVDGGELPIGKIADALAEVIQQTKNIFRFIVGQHKTTEEAVKAGNYDWANNNVNSRNFPLRPRPVGQKTIEFVEFDHDSISEEAIEKARKRGLERPTYEDALDFGEQYPEEQRKHPIVFLHEPWQSPGGSLLVLVLVNYSSKRNLNLHWFSYRWNRTFVFAFVRK